MIYFKNILLEIEDDKTAKEIADKTAEEIAREIGNKLKQELEQELEKASKQQNEAILTTAAFILSLPGILNFVIKTAKFLSETLLKKYFKTSDNPEVWYNILDKFTENIDSYIGKPFDIILKPIISDNIKRKKAVNLLKAFAIATMAITGNVDMSKSLKTLTYLKSIYPAFSSEISQYITEKSVPNLITWFKKEFPLLLNKP